MQHRHQLIIINIIGAPVKLLMGVEVVMGAAAPLTHTTTIRGGTYNCLLCIRLERSPSPVDKTVVLKTWNKHWSRFESQLQTTKGEALYSQAVMN